MEKNGGFRSDMNIENATEPVLEDNSMHNGHAIMEEGLRMEVRAGT